MASQQPNAEEVRLKMKRYEQLAEEIAQSIRNGILSPGEKVPSVRHASRSFGVSPSTVFQAYYLLEDRGLIQARERSGYYVRQQANQLLAEPDVGVFKARTTEVNVSQLAFSVLNSLRDPNTIPFGSAFPDPDLFPLARLSRSMSHALRGISGKSLICDMTGGHPDLLRQISQRYVFNGITIQPGEVVVTGGAMEALNLCLQAVTAPGDMVAVEAPAFYGTLQALERLKLKAVEIPVHPRKGIDLTVLAESLQTLPIKACWFMTHLQNPVGASMDEHDKQELYELLAHHEIPLIEDDVYAELYFGTQPPRPVKHFDSKGLVMHCCSFSKTLAPGYRIGWAAAGRYANRVEQLRLMTTISPSIPAQMAIADYLQHGGYDRHLRKLRHTLEVRQGEMLAAASRYFPAQSRVTRPAGGFLLWFELPEQVDSLALFHRALAEGISLAPGPIFSASRHFKNCIRLNYGYPWTNEREKAMRTLGSLVSSLI
ncbi:DNA-binding transcriptional MocR family regulator [Pseudomonas psychrotolerans]|nr:DNA-binding transcriptional MocR family regulator [Pseudomonas psychrotolerans]